MTQKELLWLMTDRLMRCYNSRDRSVHCWLPASVITATKICELSKSPLLVMAIKIQWMILIWYETWAVLSSWNSKLGHRIRRVTAEQLTNTAKFLKMVTKSHSIVSVWNSIDPFQLETTTDAGGLVQWTVTSMDTCVCINLTILPDFFL